MVADLRAYLEKHSPYIKRVDYVSTDPGANFESKEFKGIKGLSEPVYYFQTGQVTREIDHRTIQLDCSFNP